MPTMMTTCHACSASVATLAAFCSSCGAKQGGRVTWQTRIPAQVPPEEVFDASPGGSDEPPPEPEPQPEPATTHPIRSRLPSARIAAIAAAAVLSLVAVSIIGLHLAGVGAGPSEAEQKTATVRALQLKLGPQLDTLMRARGAFFDAERSYLPAMKESKAEIAQYAKQGKAAKAPDLDAQIAQLREVSREMNTLRAEVVGIQPITELTPAYTQLTTAVEALGSNAEQNARILADAVHTSDEGDGGEYVDQAKLASLNGNDALAPVKELNRTLVAVLTGAQLPLARYDVPGGRDVDPDDHSTSI